MRARCMECGVRVQRCPSQTSPRVLRQIKKGIYLCRNCRIDVVNKHLRELERKHDKEN